MVKIYHAGARGNIVRTDQGLATVVAGLFLLGGTQSQSSNDILSDSSTSSSTTQSSTVIEIYQDEQSHTHTRNDIPMYDELFNILLDKTTSCNDKIILLNKLQYKCGHISDKEQLLSFIYRIRDIYKGCLLYCDSYSYNKYIQQIRKLDRCIVQLTL